MFHRIIQLPQTHSFFLFGARGTGKTTLLKQRLTKDTWYIDLLDLDVEDQYRLDPESLARELDARAESTSVVIIDEIQKLPRLLDIVHRKIEETNIQFILTGSSARKLKRGSANMLAGRAFVYNLFPLTSVELADAFDLETVLMYGTLPYIYNLTSVDDRIRYLKTYVQSYLKEEVWGEQLIRALDPFRAFLEVAAQAHGQVINYSTIARDVGVDTKTVQNYFQILEDTLIGVLLNSYHRSVRKRQRQAPKFYFFDSGIQRILSNTIDIPLRPGTYAYGLAFEHFIIMDIMRRAAYQEKNFRFSYLRAEGGAEVDLVIETAEKTILVEIKSSERVTKDNLRHLQSYSKDFPDAELICLARVPRAELFDRIKVMPWKEGIETILREY
ncbi:MAG: ATP-binding protein [Candidatus Dadabacteria bacterium]|nr:MAG: ATP-binding protein [Candidatus Dadabacteria bacterium]